MTFTPHRLIQVPPGVQCFVGEEARRRRTIERLAVSVFEGWDYEEIIPPLYDYADVFAGPALESRTYSFVGRDGSLLALRPDFTSLLAKIAAGRLAGRPAPIRLYYSGEVLRYEPPKAGRQSELFQMGLEHLGGDGRTADVEVLAVAAECLEALGIKGYVLALGHVGIFGGLAAECGLASSRLEALRERIEAKDAAGVRDVLSGEQARPGVADALVRLSGLAGGADVVEDATAIVGVSPAAAAALEELAVVVRAFRDAGLADRIAVDLAEVRGLDYYTGLVFRAYAPSLGFEVGSGGRYDALLGRFGRPMPAVGFMLGLDRVALLLERQGTPPDASAPSSETIDTASLDAALRAARERRVAGSRVRFGNGGKAGVARKG
jgi:ATP phosphoribosyltransferase regulatory subunit